MSDKIFIRGLKKVDFGVFCVDGDGQKYYFDPIFNKPLPYSSGQQVKKSINHYISDNYDIKDPKAIFVHNVEKGKLKQGEVLPHFGKDVMERLIKGFMNTPGSFNNKIDFIESDSFKRRSPLSISAMCAFSPQLVKLIDEKVITNFIDNPTIVINTDDNKTLVEDDVAKFLDDNNFKINPIKLIGGEKRAAGIFKYNIELELERLFRLSLEKIDNEAQEMDVKFLKENGATEVVVNGKKYLQFSDDFIKMYAKAISESIVSWSINSNSSRTFDTMPTFAVIVSNKKLIDVDRAAYYDEELGGIDMYGGKSTVFLEKFGKQYVKNIDDSVIVSNYANDEAAEYIESKILQYYNLL